MPDSPVRRLGAAAGRRWRAPVVLAYAAFVLVGIAASVGGVVLPAQIADYGVGKATIGLVFFTSSAGVVLAGITTGPLVHRLGIRAVLAAGGVGFMLAALYKASFPPFAGLVAVQLVAGYGMGLMESALNAYLAEQSSATTLLNRLHAFFGVGALLGPLLAAWMLSVWPWTAVYLVLALLAVLLVAGFLAVYPAPATTGEDPDGHGTPAPGTEPGTPEPRPRHAPSRGGLLAAALRQPAVLLGTVFLTVYVGLEISVGNWAFSLLVEEHGQRGLLAGYAVSGYWLGLTLGRFVISPLATRWGLTAAGMTFACLAGVTAAAVLAWLAPAAAVAGAGLVLLGFFLGPLFPTAMAVVPNLTASRLVPTAIGVMNGGSAVGGAVLPWLAGATAERVGVWTLMPFAVTLALLLIVIWRLMVARMTTTA